MNSTANMVDPKQLKDEELTLIAQDAPKLLSRGVKELNSQLIEEQTRYDTVVNSIELNKRLLTTYYNTKIPEEMERRREEYKRKLENLNVIRPSVEAVAKDVGSLLETLRKGRKDVLEEEEVREHETVYFTSTDTVRDLERALLHFKQSSIHCLWHINVANEAIIFRLATVRDARALMRLVPVAEKGKPILVFEYYPEALPTQVGALP